MRSILFAFCFCLLTGSLLAQVNRQTVRGIVSDGDSEGPLAGAKVMLIKDSTVINGSMTDTLGRFRIEAVPVGRYTLVATYLGYERFSLPNLQVNSGREVIQHIGMSEAFVQMEGVEITASSKDQAINEMAYVSARTFSIEEADRYAGSRGDPARMASNFAGVQGGDDSRNDIVVRGNSPLGVQYRLEGIDIPNPNHFSILGGTGGPVSILNNKVLSNSDFFTGAFPAEYGNSTAAVFDLGLRNGNNEKTEFTGQLGLLGAEALIEGPISKQKRSSYLINYRYATIALMEVLGINFGIAALPQYQDLTFKLNFPQKNGDNLSVWGIGGASNIKIENAKRNPEDIYDNDIGKDVRFGSRMGMGGVKYLKRLGDDAWLKSSVYASINYSYSFHDTLNDLSLPATQQVPGLFMRLRYYNSKIGTAHMYNRKLSTRATFRAGLHLDYVNSFGIDSTRYLSPTEYRLRSNYNVSTAFTRGYAQLKYKLSPGLTLNTGLHAMYLFLNGSFALEPRAGLRWQASDKHAFSLGYGLHNQLQPWHIYHQALPDARTGGFVQRDLDFTRSQHLVSGWDWRISNFLRTRVELYYQNLSNVPVEDSPSAFSLLNQGASFVLLRPEDTLVNEGSGRNFGLELTLEKFFSRGYFFLITGSLFESQYRGSDGVLRDTDYNGNYSLSTLVGKELPLGKKKNTILGLSFNATYAGGKRYSPIDLDASRAFGEYRGIDSLTNTLQLDNYFRADLRVSLRINRPKVSHEIAFDGVNFLNRENQLGLIFDQVRDVARLVPQLQFFPILYYRIEF